jgi:DUF1016 N-terminal domain
MSLDIYFFRQPRFYPERGFIIAEQEDDRGVVGMIDPLDAAMEKSFAEVVVLIQSAKQRAMQAVNTQLVELYWQVGAYISHKLEQAEWGDGMVQQLADYLARTQPGLRGFTRANLFRMRKFYETYGND